MSSGENEKPTFHDAICQLARSRTSPPASRNRIRDLCGPRQTGREAFPPAQSEGEYTRFDLVEVNENGERIGGGNPKGCFGRVHNAHNSSRKPGYQYIQANPTVICPQGQPSNSLIVVDSRLHIEDADDDWVVMITNYGICPSGSSTLGWNNCWPNNYGRHPVIETGANSICITGTTYDYLQTAWGSLITSNGTVCSKFNSKIGENAYCRGK